MMKSGERAKKSGEIMCLDCEGNVYVEQGQQIPECPCGGTEFEEAKSQQKAQDEGKKRRTA